MPDFGLIGETVVINEALKHTNNIQPKKRSSKLRNWLINGLIVVLSILFVFAFVHFVP